ncbi:MAG: DNA-directed RNA polymerase subunit beta [Armatimonadetes bacterium]|nr:DNA-directed RNA polymerase subunit beta [Armatimonadota bacterium]NOG93930.1 DNA-directed RNA polymerase subunit beta [Armatimonadota bacterium]
MKEIRHASKRLGAVLEVPNLIELQLNSYRSFVERGLPELLQSFSPIWDFTHSNYIEFLDFTLGQPKYSLEECRDRDVTYEAPIKVQVRLGGKEREVIESEVYLGDLPLMTDHGTFIINGRERVIVSQLSRSPGIYFFDEPQQATKWELRHVLMHRLPMRSEILPNQGKWLEIAEVEPDFVLQVTLSQSKRVPLTQVMKAFWGLPQARTFINRPLERAIHMRLAEPLVDKKTGEVLGDKDTLITESFVKSLPKALLAAPHPVYSRTETNEDLLLLFGTNKKLKSPTAEDLVGKRANEDIKDGESLIVAKHGRIDRDTAKKIESLKFKTVDVLEVNPFIDATLAADTTDNTASALKDLHRKLRPGETPDPENAKTQLFGLYFDPRNYDLGRVGRHQINRRLGIDISDSVRNLTAEDLVHMVYRMTRLLEGEISGDDIDHLQNKRIRSIGDLLQAQMRVGLGRMEKVARERMTSAEPEALLPGIILSVKPVMASIKSFFSSSHLSTFMDQTNPMSEISNKRRLSTLPDRRPSASGKPGVVDAQREVQPSEYGRICPIETPEGPNVGLMKQLTVFAKIDDDGFLHAPFRKVENGYVTDEIEYLVAGEEDGRKVAPPDALVDDRGRLATEYVQVRFRGEFPEVKREDVELMDASPVIFSVAAACIPFLNHDDGARALMGSNMQRQAVPLLRSERPIVGTGYEERIAVDSGSSIRAERTGTVEYVTAQEIVIRPDGNGSVDRYVLNHMRQSNKSTCFTHRPIVFPGQRVRVGQPIADGPSCDQGHLALGKNLVVAFMPWRGYNYEDAIVVSERLVRDDVFTSIHIERYDTEAVDTKLGPEEITRDIPNVGEDSLKDLDESGIVRIGADVRPLDILVGKVAPKGQVELTAEERLIIAIFGKKAEETRDVSLRVPHGEQGTVVDVKVFSRYKYRCKDTGKIFYESKKREHMVSEITGGELEQIPGDELPAGTNMTVQVHVAQKRKLTVGDKMAGRHGNKGVISRIVAVEDMPVLEDGTPVDIVLNPLGVPSRLNDGQMLETMLGLVGKQLGLRFFCPAFEGSRPEQVFDELTRIAEKMRADVLQAYANSELGLGVEFEYGATVDEMLAEIETALKSLGKTRLEQVSQIVAADPAFTIGDMDPDAVLEVADNEPPYKAPKAVYESILNRIRTNVWVRAGIDEETGKSLLRDGVTGERFEFPVAVGVMYMFKLEHLAEEKIHARSIGPYSLVTQQPLGGKAQFGGQRFGEMEVWALEAYGAANTLQEIITIKSDDVMGRVRTYESIVRGETLLEPGVPESFKILVNELRSLGLRVTVEDKGGREINLRDLDEQSYGDDMKLARSVGFF